MNNQTARHRILIVEDDPIIAMMLEDAVRGLGFEPIGPISSVAGALKLINGHDVSAAVLDCNLGDEYVWPLADRLAATHVPFLFSTGYGRSGIPERFGDHSVLSKPFSMTAFNRALSLLLYP
jgi:DNA-binding response OmpR family regulator